MSLLPTHEDYIKELEYKSESVNNLHEWLSQTEEQTEEEVKVLTALLKEAQHVLVVNNLDGYDIYKKITKYLNSTK